MRVIIASHRIPADGCSAAREINSVLLGKEDKSTYRRLALGRLSGVTRTCRLRARQIDTQKRGIGRTFSPACHLASRVLFSASEFFENRRGTLKKCLKIFYFG